MPSIFIKDSLRQSVEGATGGKVTVLYSADGKPGYYCIVPKFRIEDIDPALGSGVHPAFLVQGQEKSELFIGQFQASVVGGMALSLPGQTPTATVTFDQARSCCTALGSGFHLMTNAEWAAIALWCHKNGFLPRGNSQNGQSSDAGFETGNIISMGITLTGSGPVSWRHDNHVSGIADLCGNVWEWSAGLRMVEGELQIVRDNDAALPGADLSTTSSAWRAIRPDGSLVAPGSEGTLKIDCTLASADSQGLPRLSDSVVNRKGPVGDTSYGQGHTNTPLQMLTAKEGLSVPALLKTLGLFPLSAELDGDTFIERNYGERLAVRGGSKHFGSGAGVFSLGLNQPRTGAQPDVGFRPAFVL